MKYDLKDYFYIFSSSTFRPSALILPWFTLLWTTFFLVLICVYCCELAAKKLFKVSFKKLRIIYTWIAVIAARMAGVPNPCEIMEKLVRCLCTAGSRTGLGRVAHRGDLSWFKKSTNSLKIYLEVNNMNSDRSQYWKCTLFQ